MSNIRPSLTLLFLLLAVATPNTPGQEPLPVTPAELIRSGDKVIKINDAINMVAGFGNTFLVTTSEGNVVIDTSSPMMANVHRRLLSAAVTGPVKYIILTHGHGDHTGGIQLWKE